MSGDLVESVSNISISKMKRTKKMATFPVDFLGVSKKNGDWDLHTSLQSLAETCQDVNKSKEGQLIQ